MGFDIVRGFIAKPQQTRLLVDEVTKYFRRVKDSGTLYLGYPLTASSDKKVTVDAMIVSELCGVVAFIIGESSQPIEELRDEQDALYFHFDHYLKKYPTLRKGRILVVEPKVITIVLDKRVEDLSTEEYAFCRVETIGTVLKGVKGFNKTYYKALCEALLKVANIRPQKKRSKVVIQNSKGWIIREIERELANLDEWQKKRHLKSLMGLNVSAD